MNASSEFEREGDELWYITIRHRGGGACLADPVPVFAAGRTIERASGGLPPTKLAALYFFSTGCYLPVYRVGPGAV